MPDTPKLDHALVEQSLELFHEFVAAIHQSAARKKVEPFVDRYRAGIYRLVLVGEEKRGKSSLVNALLGEPDLVPVGPEPMTSSVFKIIYGPKKQHRVFFLPNNPDDPDSSRRAPLDVSTEEVIAYGTEKGNPGNEKGVDFIAVEHPHPLLMAGLTIVDLPGLGGLKYEHGTMALSYLPNADAALFVIDSVAATLTRDEVSTLERLLSFTDTLVFVQTKIDAVSALQWQSWRDRNFEEIEKRLKLEPAQIRYFPVSSTLKLEFDRNGSREDLVESGFEPLIQLLEEDLIPRKHDRLAITMLAALAQEIADATQPIETEITILTAVSRTEIDRIEAELRQAQQDFERWKVASLQRVMASFHEALRDARIDAEREITRDLDPSEHGPLVGALMQRVEERKDVSARWLAEQSASLNDCVVQVCAARLSEIGEKFSERAFAAYNRAADEIGQATTPIVISSSHSVVDLPFERVKPRVRHDLWNAAMQARMGGFVGGLAGTFIAGLLFPPGGLATAAVVVLGSLFGASRSILEANARERNVVEQRLRVLLVDSVRRLQHYGTREFNILVEDVRSKMLASLNDAVQRRSEGERAALAAIQRKRRQSQEDNASQVTTLRSHLALARTILELLRKVGVPRGKEARGAAA